MACPAQSTENGPDDGFIINDTLAKPIGVDLTNKDV